MHRYIISYDLTKASPQQRRKVSLSIKGLGKVKDGPTTTWILESVFPVDVVRAMLYRWLTPNKWVLAEIGDYYGHRIGEDAKHAALYEALMKRALRG